jgi:hypothetical protein
MYYEYVFKYYMIFFVSFWLFPYPLDFITKLEFTECEWMYELIN